jgi:hypothetical protein
MRSTESRSERITGTVSRVCSQCRKLSTRVATIASASTTAELARLDARLDDLRQIVDGVEENVVQPADLDFDVTRHGEIDHEHRPVPARLDRALDEPEADDRQLAGGAGDDDVELGQTLATSSSRIALAPKRSAMHGRDRSCGWR